MGRVYKADRSLDAALVLHSLALQSAVRCTYTMLPDHRDHKDATSPYIILRVYPSSPSVDSAIFPH